MTQSIADRDKAQREFSRYQRGYDKGAFTEQDLDSRRQAYKASEAAVDVSQARVSQAKIALNSEIGGENTRVAQSLAELRQAEFDLEQTVVKAPTDGFATQLALRPGVMAVPLPLAPVMTFVHTEETLYAAAFRQTRFSVYNRAMKQSFSLEQFLARFLRDELLMYCPLSAKANFKLVALYWVLKHCVPMDVFLLRSKLPMIYPVIISPWERLSKLPCIQISSLMYPLCAKF